MDKMLWVAMTGADQLLDAQSIVAHNLANASTQGYRADLHAFSSYLVQGPGFPTRIDALAEQLGFDPRVGTLQDTGRPLDVAVRGPGYLAVQAPDGAEAYTRAGDLRVNAEGLLETATGLPVLGDGGPVSVPPAAKIEIGGDGTVSVVPQGLGPEALAAIGRLRLVNPPHEQLVKGPDGLLRMRDATQAPADATVRLTSGALESSNVNVAETLVEMIEISRQFEMQVRLMNTADSNDAAVQQLLRIN